MKKYFFLLVVIFSTPVFAQFKLSGNIKNYTGHTGLKINIPLIYGFDEANSIHIPVHKNGSFSITLPIKAQKFADLIFQQNFHLVLLSAGKSLKVELSETDKSFRPTAGTGHLPENTVLLAANVEEYPFFLQNAPAYTNLSPVALNEKLLKPYFAMRDKKIAIVNQSSISPKDKKLITSELKYASYNNLYELVLFDQYSEKVNKFVIDAFDKADPKPEVFPAGPQYYMFANYYLWYKGAKAFLIAKAQNLKPSQQLPNFNITIAQANSYALKYGDNYLRWLGAIKFLPPMVTEQLGYFYIKHLVKNHNKNLAMLLADDYNKKFPAGIYKKDISKKLAQLNK